MFEPHHDLKLPPVIAATHYVGLVNGAPVAHVAFSTRPGLSEARVCRLVVLPEWQGMGIGARFLNALCEQWRQGHNRYSKPLRSLFPTSHPGLAATLRRDPKWTQVSARLFGNNKARSMVKLAESAKRHGFSGGGGFGGHFRAIQGFLYLGEMVA